MPRFEVPGKPFGKQRPRFGGRIAYTPKETVTAEAVIRGEAIPHFPIPIEGPVRLDIIAVFAIPPSWSKRKAAAALSRPHTQRPDKDNIEKAVSDALNGVAFADDGQVADGRCRKVWGPVAKTIVSVEPIPTEEVWSYA